VPDDYTYEMRANHMPCPKCGGWHTAMNCPDEYSHSYNYIPVGYRKCAQCGVLVPNDETHYCATNQYPPYSYYSDNYLLQQILETLREIKERLERLEKR
jgi:hypothetical protein